MPEPLPDMPALQCAAPSLADVYWPFLGSALISAGAKGLRDMAPRSMHIRAQPMHLPFPVQRFSLVKRYVTGARRLSLLPLPVALMGLENPQMAVMLMLLGSMLMLMMRVMMIMGI